jgi:hypothetical protein
MLVIEAEGLFAIALISQIGVQFHRFDFPFGDLTGQRQESSRVEFRIKSGGVRSVQL